MGWDFTWVSSSRNAFNVDYHAAFTAEEARSGQAFFNYAPVDPGHLDREGVSVFHKDGNGAVYHAYSTYGRGIDMLNSAYNYVDLARKDAMRATSSSPRPGHGTMTDTTIEQAALSLPPVTRVVALAVD